MSTRKASLRMPKVNLLLMSLENQLLRPKNKFNKLRMVDTLKLLKLKNNKLKNKFKKQAKLLKQKIKELKRSQLLLSTRKVNLKITRAKLLQINLESQLKLLKNKSNKQKMVNQLRLLRSKLKKLKSKSIRLQKFSKKNRNKLQLFQSTIKDSLRMLMANLSLMNLESQSLLPKNKSNRLRMVNQ